MIKSTFNGSFFVNGVALLALAALPCVSLAQTHTINVAGGDAFSPNIRGQNVPLLGDNSFLTDETLKLTNNTSNRGVAGGLYADTYNWMNQTGMGVGDPGSPGNATLTHLQYARDHNSEQIITVNTRATGTGSSTSVFQYTDGTPANLAALAGKWVTYTNLIAPSYVQGDALPANYAGIVNSLQWGGQATLRSPGEAPTRKVTYWEIGNEPDVGITDNGVYSTGDGFLLTPAQYVGNYKTITSAMLAADPTIKVGPAMTRAYGTERNPYLMALLADQDARIDFINYHPYTELFGEYRAGGGWPAVSDLQARLKNIRNQQQGEYDMVYDDIQTNNDERYWDWGQFKWIYPNPQRNPNMPVMASEWNPGSYQVSGGMPGRTMAQALGAAETLFTFAQLQNMTAAQFWLWPTSHSEGAYIPMYKMFEGLQQHMGDTLLDTLVDDNKSIRLYTTKDSQSGEVTVWGLNFSDTTSQTLQLSLSNLPALPQGYHYLISLMRLANVDGSQTHLLDLTSSQAGVPMSIDWLTSNLTGSMDPANFSLTLNSAEITALVFTPASVPEPAAVFLSLMAMGGMMLRRSGRKGF